MRVRACMRECVHICVVFLYSCICVGLRVMCVFVHVNVNGPSLAKRVELLRRKHRGASHVDHVTPLSFTSYGSMSSTSHSDLTGPFLPKTLTKTKSHP